MALDKHRLPPVKELSFRLAYALLKAGGQLSASRAMELLDDYFHFSDDPAGQAEDVPAPCWPYYVLLARQ